MITSIITCDRPVSYLEQTLSNIKSFNIDPIVFKDHFTHNLPDNKLIAFEAMKYAADKREDLLFLEDDISIQDLSLFTYEVPNNCMFTSFYNSYLQPGKHDGIRFGECQALLFPVNTLKYILNRKDTYKHQINSVRGLGTVLRIIFKGLLFEVTPPMVQHLGVVSTFNYIQNKTAHIEQ